MEGVILGSLGGLWVAYVGVVVVSAAAVAAD